MFENGSTVCELEPAVTFTILLLYWSATKTAPDVSTAIPNGLFKPVNAGPRQSRDVRLRPAVLQV